MTLSTWLAFCAAALAVTLVPGPAFLAVLSSAIAGGVRRGALALLGVLIGDVLFFGCAAAGLGAVLLASPLLFGIVKWAGVAYLAYLGIRALAERASHDDAAPAVAPGALRHPTLLALSTQLANPKVVVFIAALVPAFIDVHAPVAPQFAILGATFALSDLLVFTVVVLAASRARRLFASARNRMRVRRATGVAMLGAAARVALER